MNDAGETVEHFTPMTDKRSQPNGDAMRQMTDAELLLATAEARTASHQAPLGEVTDINKHGKPTGERFITNHTRGYADRANDWAKLSDECTRRGLPQPGCLCPKTTEDGLCVKN